MGEDDWMKWDPDEWKLRRKFKADDLLRTRQMKKAEELSRDDVLGARHHINGVMCKVCKTPWKRGAINVCNGCIEYYCDDHKYRHPNCENGR